MEAGIISLAALISGMIVGYVYWFLLVIQHERTSILVHHSAFLRFLCIAGRMGIIIYLVFLVLHVTLTHSILKVISFMVTFLYLTFTKKVHRDERL